MKATATAATPEATGLSLWTMVPHPEEPRCEAYRRYSDTSTSPFPSRRTSNDHVSNRTKQRRKGDPRRNSILHSPPNPGLATDSALQFFRTNSKKRDSKISLGTQNSVASAHQQYIESLEVPSPGEITRIDAIQQHREEEVIKRRLSMAGSGLTEDERAKAAELIQRNYRGYRERRQIQGMGLDPSSRWIDAIREAKYRNLTAPRPRSNGDADQPGQPSTAMYNWRKVGTIARRAAGDEDSDDPTDDDDDKDGLTEIQRQERRRLRMEAKLERQKAAKVMDLQYWLESTDLKHRYGSNLRTYHQEWLKAETNENFFYWLDYGEGRYLDCAGCSRERLDRECVRYLSREERQSYLVKIDKEGRLCWAKNGARIDTTIHFKDSIHGIVPEDDDTPAYARPEAEAATGMQRSSSSSASSSSGSVTNEEGSAPHHSHEHTSDRAAKYANPKLENAHGVKKVKHVTAATILNKLLRSSVKKNTWIYVADTSFRFYVGIKQSGAFQHSSFLHGSRISSAGLIKIKDGKLDKLSPLSGHYRPPTSSFRAFVHNLKAEGVDMSHVSISRSYAVLVGLEAYVKTRRRGKRIIHALIRGRDKMLEPEEVKKREEEAVDKTESAARERRFLELQEAAEVEDRRSRGLMHRLHLTRSRRSVDGSRPLDLDLNPTGTGPEDGIPPAGRRSIQE